MCPLHLFPVQCVCLVEEGYGVDLDVVRIYTRILQSQLKDSFSLFPGVRAAKLTHN